MPYFPFLLRLVECVCDFNRLVISYLLEIGFINRDRIHPPAPFKGGFATFANVFTDPDEISYFMCK